MASQKDKKFKQIKTKSGSDLCEILMIMRYMNFHFDSNRFINFKKILYNVGGKNRACQQVMQAFVCT
ncbi:hypothetical protein DO021_04525 [Desulfobacter hydrogenophilus]|uniref:Uncharacterized protein n=1 Tax=Desulfobacter hydrogenophilus TaxID=2291 RepID=A0A328FEL9_9BACT|nr:hypothetical protein DO021_04525 [Desulfobacter hydrogenophilus]